MFMKKILITLSLVIIVGFIISRIPAVEDRVVITAVSNSVQTSSLPEEDALTVVVCGSRSPIPSEGRAEACVMVRAGENIYLVDTGNGSAVNLRKWNIPFNKIKSVLFTHLHSDHISDLADIHLASWIVQKRTNKLKVYGPEGVELVTQGFESAYGPDYFFRNSHHGDEIAPLDVVGFDPQTIDLNNPVIVNEDGLTVTAFKVIHDPVKPALGYRFDYKGRSLVVSGDTSYSENIIKYSEDVDVLLHEAQSNYLVRMIQSLALKQGAMMRAKIMDDITTYHTTPLEAAEIANKANAKHLVFYHLTPAPRNTIMERIFLRGVNDVREDWTLSKDGTMIVLPIDSDKISITSID